MMAFGQRGGRAVGVAYTQLHSELSSVKNCQGCSVTGPASRQGDKMACTSPALSTCWG